jgi:hypothetical protein
MKRTSMTANLLIFSFAWLIGWAVFPSGSNVRFSASLVGSQKPIRSVFKQTGIPLSTPTPEGDTPTQENLPYPYLYPYRTASPNIPIVLGAAAIMIVILAAWWIAGRQSLPKK